MAATNRDKVAVESKTIVKKTPRAVSYKYDLFQARVVILHVDHLDAKLPDGNRCRFRTAMATNVRSVSEKALTHLATLVKN